MMPESVSAEPPIAERIARLYGRALRARPEQIAAAVRLFAEGNTLPFVARYRKEVTGGLDEEQLRAIADHAARLQALDERRATVLAEVEAQGKLTPGLREAILAADTRTALEDLYQPYRPKRRTRAGLARERGLLPLAEQIIKQPVGPQTAEELAARYVSEAVPTPAEALAGARDIVAELIADNAEIRREARAKAFKWGVLSAAKNPDVEDKRGVYHAYTEFAQRIDRVKAHQVLALNRGEKEKVLRVQVELTERDWRPGVEYLFRTDRRSPLAEELRLAIEDAAQRLLLPAIERDVRRALNEEAEQHAISVFASNLRGLLTQPPLAGQTVLGIDPGLRTGCKLAVVDPTGKVLETATIYPHEPQRRRTEALQILGALVKDYQVTLVAIGNGTASRETERLVAELIRTAAPEVRYLIVNEAGASVYSASQLARAELPHLDVSLRGAVSIARRAQDPLAELVKIEPQSIGVGLYQHDVDQRELRQALAGVVESAVNQVGVDLNTASPALLRYVAGIGPKLAQDIVAYRDEQGPFAAREQLQSVPGLGPKAFEQAAGFLRIRGGSEPLDASAIHPESYPAARQVLERAGLTPAAIGALSPEQRAEALAPWQADEARQALAAELGIGGPTLTDILEQLARPGRDPREDLPAPILRSDVLSMSDLQPGMRLKGTVRNVVDFGAFVDIGVKQEGLLHRTRQPRGLVLGVGDIVDVEVVGVEPERQRISLAWAGER